MPRPRAAGAADAAPSGRAQPAIGRVGAMPLGLRVAVPLVSPLSAPWLARLAALIAGPEGGRVEMVTVLAPDAPDRARREAEALVTDAAQAATLAGADAAGHVLRHTSVDGAVLGCMDDLGASLVLMGWQGESSHRNVFGELIDTIVGRSRIPLAIVRTGEEAPRRLLVPVSQDHLLPGGAAGVELAVDLAGRLRAGLGAPVMLLRTGEVSEQLPANATELSDRVHHDPRRVDQAVGAIARPDDLIVAPVAPTAEGLRAATTHMAWAAPRSGLLVAIDVGPPPSEPLAPAVSQAGSAPGSPLAAPDADDAEHAILVTLRTAEAAGHASAALVAALQLIGPVEGPHPDTHADGRAVLRATVRVTAPSANVALAATMTALHESAALGRAEISYDLA